MTQGNIPEYSGNSTRPFLNMYLACRRLSREEKKGTQPPPKENLLENFSGLKEKLSRPVVDTQKPCKNQAKTISTTENFPLWTPCFSSGKEKFCLEQGSVFFQLRPANRYLSPQQLRIPQDCVGIRVSRPHGQDWLNCGAIFFIHPQPPTLKIPF